MSERDRDDFSEQDAATRNRFERIYEKRRHTAESAQENLKNFHKEILHNENISSKLKQEMVNGLRGRVAPNVLMDNYKRQYSGNEGGYGGEEGFDGQITGYEEMPWDKDIEDF